jgi:hypothetical protein
MKVHRIDFDAVKRWRLKLREPLAQAARARMNRGDALADAVAAAATMRRIDARAEELRAEGADVTEAAVSAALEVLGGGRDGR